MALRSFRAAARDYIDHGDRVLVLGHLHAEHAHGEFHVPYVQVWEFHAGKARRVEALTDTLQIATALSGQECRQHA